MYTILFVNYTLITLGVKRKEKEKNGRKVDLPNLLINIDVRSYRNINNVESPVRLGSVSLPPGAPGL